MTNHYEKGGGAVTIRRPSRPSHAITLVKLGHVLNYPRFGFQSKRRSQGMVYLLAER